MTEEKEEIWTTEVAVIAGMTEEAEVVIEEAAVAEIEEAVAEVEEVAGLVVAAEEVVADLVVEVVEEEVVDLVVEEEVAAEGEEEIKSIEYSVLSIKTKRYRSVI